ncbi:MAG: 50S ribosomal protein L4 [bacterium]
MNKAVLLDKKGKKIEELELPEVFNEAKPNKDLIAQAVKIYLGNQRESNAQTKTRGMVQGSSRKLYRQKGTGNSRQGSVRSPLHRKGGVVFGPTNEKNYKAVLSKKMKKLAIRSVLTLKAKEGEILVASEVDMPKTKWAKYAEDFVKNSKVKGSVLVVTNTSDLQVQKAFGNIEKVTVSVLNELNTYMIANASYIIFMKDCIEVASKFWKK